MRRNKIRRLVRFAPLAAACFMAASGPVWGAFNFISDTWLPPGGGTNPDWLNPTLWSTGTVPNDDSVNKYLVTIPGSNTVNLANDPPYTASSSTVYDLNLGSNTTLNIDIPLTIEDNLNATSGNIVVQGVTLKNLAQQTGIGDPLNVSVQSGGTADLGYQSLSLNSNNNQTYSADGLGSLVDLHTVQNLFFGGVGGYGYTFSASNDATVDLSGVTSISVNNNDRDANLYFNASTGGIIKLTSLQTINATTNQAYKAQINFNLGTTPLSLPALTSAHGTNFNLVSGGSISAPLLTNVAGSFITLAGGSTFTTGGLSQIDNAGLAVNTGATLAVTATSYLLGGYNNTTDSADGSGSLLNLHTVQNFSFGGVGGYGYTVSASNNGTVDLSGVTSISVNNNDRDVNLYFNESTGGIIKLNSLQTIGITTNQPYKAQINFNFGSTPFSLPALVNAQATNFNLVTGSSVSVPLLTNLTSYSDVAVPSGASFNAPKLTNVTGSFITVAGGGTFTTGGLSQINNAGLAVNTGATLAVTATSYLLGGTNNTTDSADGSGSLLDLHTVQNFSFGGVGGYGYTVSASNNGTVDLSGVTSLAVNNNDRDANLYFNESTGGIIKLNSLQTIGATNQPYKAQINFNLSTTPFSLPELISGGTTNFNLVSGSSVSLPLLSTLTSYSDVNVPMGATFNAPTLTRITDSFITLAGGGIFNTGSLSQINDTGFAVNTGGSLAVTAASYSLGGTNNTTDSADGNGSLLDLHTVQNLFFGGVGGYGYTVSASNNGTVDLSGMTSISVNNNDRDANLYFNTSTGGIIKLNSLQTINATTNQPYKAQINFNFGATPSSFPALVNAQATNFNLTTGSSVSLPLLSTLTVYSDVAVPSGATFNAPKLTNVTGSFITVAGGGTFTTGGLSQINNAGLTVNTGATLPVTATSYLLSSYNNITDSADGSGSLLDLHTVQNVSFGGSGGYSYSFSASNNATVDLSGVTSIGVNNNDRDANLYFGASTGGTVKLTSLQAIGATTNQPYRTQTHFSASGGGNIILGNVISAQWSDMKINDAASSITVRGSLFLDSNSNLNMASGSSIGIGGNFSYNSTNPSQLSASSAIVKMDGAGLQTLELAGLDAGAVNPGNNGNFGFGQLQVGQPTVPTEVDLVDNVNNGNRGAGNANEALYLYGINGQGGLVLNGGSVLLIGNLNAYSYQDGSWTNLQNLFTGSQTIIPYTLNGSDGYIARNLTALQAVWQNPGNGAWNTGANWNINSVPGIFNDVFITPVTGVTVAGPTSSTTFRSVTIDATPSGTLSVLNFSSASTITVENNIQIGAQSQINEQAGTLTAQQMTVGGSFAQSSGTTFKLSGALPNSGGLTSGGAVTSAGSFTVGGIFVNNGTYIQSAGSANIGSIAGIGATNIGPGVTLNVGSFTQLGGLVSNGIVNIHGSGTVKSITGNGALTINGGTLQIAVNAGLNSVSSLSIGPGAALDIGNSHLIINYGSGADPIASIAAWIVSGYAGGTWNGTGIMSSIAQINAGSYGIGYADSADPNNPAGLASGTIEIKYTLLGDANLDGTVNGSDFAILATNFNKAVSGWDQGDFNYDHADNGADFAALAANFNKGASQSSVSAGDSASLDSFAAANGLLADVPEPASAGMMIAIAAGILQRRRRL